MPYFFDHLTFRAERGLTASEIRAADVRAGELAAALAGLRAGLARRLHAWGGGLKRTPRRGRGPLVATASPDRASQLVS